MYFVDATGWFFSVHGILLKQSSRLAALATNKKIFSPFPFVGNYKGRSPSQPRTSALNLVINYTARFLAIPTSPKNDLQIDLNGPP